MTEAKSPREIAEHRERLEIHLKWLRGFPDTAIGQKTADAIESLISYAAERERLHTELLEAVRLFEAIPAVQRAVGILHTRPCDCPTCNLRRILSSRPATEGKGDD